MRCVSATLLLASGLVTATGCATGQTAARPEAFPSPASAPPATVTTPVPLPPAPAGTAAILQTAFDLVGTPYRFGGTSPDTGFDCSGFVGYVLRQHGLQLPRTVAEQFETGRAIAQDDVQAGDLVFFSTTGPGATHVGLVVSTGERWEFIHAPADGSSVRVERFDTGYWQRRWIGARRVQRT